MYDRIATILAAAADSLRVVAGQFVAVLRYPLDPGQRVYFIYLLSATGLAALVYLRHRRQSDSAPASLASFIGFLLPRKVWSDPSAWLDVRYFFFHQMIRLLIYGGFLAGSVVLSAELAGNALGILLGRDLPLRSDFTAGGTLTLLLVMVLINDFGAFLMHYLQHKSPLLWEFHKVHHSATVLHPLSNYREHPVDNLAYALVFGLGAGVVSFGWGLAFGYLPEPVLLLGGSVVTFLFNLFGYNLRHSHVWLSWPGVTAKLFGSPAHHQVHHSCHPDHIDRNFAFIFPIWDVLFGTFCLPGDDRDVRFGLGTGEEREFRSCLGLYLLPFLKLARRYGFHRRGAALHSEFKPDRGTGSCDSQPDIERRR